MAHTVNFPRLNAKAFSTNDLCKLYRILDGLEETSNMAHQYLHHIEGKDTAASLYVDQMQEYLSAERWELVAELRDRPASDDSDGQHRLSVILQYEAWCMEFKKETVQEFAESSFAKEVA